MASSIYFNGRVHWVEWAAVVGVAVRGGDVGPCGLDGCGELGMGVVSRFDVSDQEYRSRIRGGSMDEVGEWPIDCQQWATPFTEEQVERLQAVPITDPDQVAVVRVRPVGEFGWYTVERPATVDELVGELGDPGDEFDVQFGTMTREELNALPEFDGW